jgi:hypothetical protein
LYARKATRPATGDLKILVTTGPALVSIRRGKPTLIERTRIQYSSQ